MLVPMSQSIFEAFKAEAIAEHARDSRPSTGLSAQEALEHATADFGRLAPLGIATPGHYFFCIHEEQETGAEVGYLWIAVFEQDRLKLGYIYELMVQPQFRRRGYAAAALRDAEALARELGLSALRLHTFGHNLAALALYRKIGFEPINVVMQKSLEARR